MGGFKNYNMVKKTVQAIIFVLIIIILLGLTGFSFAQTTNCPGVGSKIRVIPGNTSNGTPITNNVRPNPGGNVANNKVIRSITFSDGEFIVIEGPVTKNGDEWIKIQPGWIWNHNLDITCFGPTPTRIPSVTPTTILPTPQVVQVCDKKRCFELEMPITICEQIGCRR